MKNKHNTMNSASQAKTYIQMQDQLLHDDKCACALVEVISKKSQNSVWSPKVNGEKVSHNHIRRISIDQFLALVTGQDDAFYQLCLTLADLIPDIVNEELNDIIPEDTAFDELQALADDKKIKVVNALYLLAFSSYIGFDKNLI
jgi:hypothetical protein